MDQGERQWAIVEGGLTAGAAPLRVVGKVPRAEVCIFTWEKWVRGQSDQISNLPLFLMYQRLRRLHRGPKDLL